MKRGALIGEIDQQSTSKQCDLAPKLRVPILRNGKWRAREQQNKDENVLI